MEHLADYLALGRRCRDATGGDGSQQQNPAEFFQGTTSTDRELDGLIDIHGNRTQMLVPITKAGTTKQLFLPLIQRSR